MFGATARDARRTEIYLDGLMAAEERRATRAPVDMDVDPAVLLAARHLREDLVRPHPSFRFEEGLARRLAQAAHPALPVVSPAPAEPDHRSVTLSLPRLASLTSKSARPLIVGGVASAISIGAVYVAWRWSRGSGSPMARAVRAARTGRGHSSERDRRVHHGVFGVES
jgi:hypothetical protein